MVTRIRLDRLRRRMDEGRSSGPRVNLVEVWLPDNGRGEPRSGRHPIAGIFVNLIIYEPVAPVTFEEAHP